MPYRDPRDAKIAAMTKRIGELMHEKLEIKLKYDDAVQCSIMLRLRLEEMKAGPKPRYNESSFWALLGISGLWIFLAVVAGLVTGVLIGLNH